MWLCELDFLESYLILVIFHDFLVIAISTSSIIVYTHYSLTFERAILHSHTLKNLYQIPNIFITTKTLKVPSIMEKREYILSIKNAVFAKCKMIKYFFNSTKIMKNARVTKDHHSYTYSLGSPKTII